MIFKLDDHEIVFPRPELADPDGLLAIGGDLSAERLMLAYKNGIFPWFSEGDPICWYAPIERCVIFPGNIVISKSMAKLFKSEAFKITYDQSFEEVIENCAKISRKDQDGTWITRQMQEAYIELHKRGYAHSVEVWQNGLLVGGLYGIQVNQIFCGESMFSKVSNASKYALIWLCRNKTFNMIDCQLPNDHLMSLGAEMISNEEYVNCLKAI
ncbi:MAG: leucyl/phenylalanyl-tRNA--protein transferase [Candidatus Pedobacter colombiensis]|uniref:Leucyl/phenylalanyl-tRNA--protein transferase n=1 Tax=Candidatus Pedobacter colombiensis TaxID=3121371 RepID=A0AAJ5W9G3_9SPHI|nr:leucyl/phenylalanyl-tRNA--protein transferase [Pedobacter sp.]WEK19484.1 MAG: leucyl/phenylalanyl-tRNA--protein transferase [Pedobacter sp.]